MGERWEKPLHAMTHPKKSNYLSVVHGHGIAVQAPPNESWELRVLRLNGAVLLVAHGHGSQLVSAKGKSGFMIAQLKCGSTITISRFSL
jgi:hypothetical protein